MNFERGGNVKESLKIGRIANSFKMDSIEIHAEILLPAGSLPNEIKLNPSIIHFNFFIKDISRIKKILETLDRMGICEEFNDDIIETIRRDPEVQKEVFKTCKGSAVSMNYDLWEISLRHLIFIANKIQMEQWDGSINYPEPIEKMFLTFKNAGKDLLYRNKLYKIAKNIHSELENHEK